MEVYVYMVNNSDDEVVGRLIYEFYLLCKQQERDSIDRTAERKRIIHQLFMELENDPDTKHYSATD